MLARPLIIAAALAVPAAAFAQTKPAQPQAAPAAQAAPQTMTKADFLKQVDGRFAAIDTNHDGSVTKDEVAAMTANMPRVFAGRHSRDGGPRATANVRRGECC